VAPRGILTATGLQSNTVFKAVRGTILPTPTKWSGPAPKGLVFVGIP